MNNHESRIHAMLADTGGSWPLNDEDRAAIQWLVDYAQRLNDDLYASQRESSDRMVAIIEMRRAAEKASADFMRIAVK